MLCSVYDYANTSAQDPVPQCCMTTYRNQIAGSVPAYVILCMPVSSLPCYASICLSAASWLSMLPSCCICLAVQPILHMHQAGACYFIASDTKYIIPVRVRLLPVCLSATKRKQVILQAKRYILLPKDITGLSMFPFLDILPG